MKLKAIWTNYKIYAFIMGIVAGTIVYNLLCVDFSFSMYEKIQIHNFWKSYAFFLVKNLKFFIIALVISFFEIRYNALAVIIFYQSFVLAGLITTMILSGNYICIYALPAIFIKIASAIFLFDISKPVLNKIISIIIILFGTIFQNFFIIYF